jgi:hypothetical protein
VFEWFVLHRLSQITSPSSVPQGALSQLFHSAKPILVRGTFGASPRGPEFVRQRRNIVVAEGVDSMAVRSNLSLLMSAVGMFMSLP